MLYLLSKPHARAIILLSGICLSTLTACGSFSSSTSTPSSTASTVDAGETTATSSTQPSPEVSDLASTIAVAGADLSGSYAINGTNPDGTKYEGGLTVTERGDVYQFSWTAGNTFEGVGIQSGDFVAVGYGGEGCAVVNYQILEDGTLSGIWGAYGQNQTGTEQATRKQSEEGIAGTYTLAGTNPDRTAYTGELTITPAGDLYQFEWQANGESRGVGIQQGNAIAVAYGNENCAVVGYQRQPNGALDGKWAFVGASALGTEQATQQ